MIIGRKRPICKSRLTILEIAVNATVFPISFANAAKQTPFYANGKPRPTDGFWPAGDNSLAAPTQTLLDDVAFSAHYLNSRPGSNSRLHVDAEGRESEWHPGPLRSCKEPRSQSVREKSPVLLAQTPQDVRAADAVSIPQLPPQSVRWSPRPPADRCQPESRSASQDRQPLAPNRSASPRSCPWLGRLLTRNTGLKISMSLVGIIAFASLQHIFPGSFSLSHESRALLRCRGRAVDSIDHERVRRYPLLLRGRNGPLFKFVGELQ
jgi:hypothetical protein